jgi:hypothetical protein
MRLALVPAAAHPIPPQAQNNGNPARYRSSRRHQVHDDGTKICQTLPRLTEHVLHQVSLHRARAPHGAVRCGMHVTVPHSATAMAATVDASHTQHDNCVSLYLRSC